MRVELRAETFNAYQELSKYKPHDDFGAESIFIGHMRSNAGQIKKMLIEHYPVMTEKQLHNIAKTAKDQYALNDVLILHRTGEIFPDETIVLIACWSQHREEAINASRYLIEALKSTVPFWKKEWQENTSHWVEANTKAIYD